MIYYARARASVGERAHHVRVWAHMRVHVCARVGGGRTRQRAGKGGEERTKTKKKGRKRRRDFEKSASRQKFFRENFVD